MTESVAHHRHELNVIGALASIAGRMSHVRVISECIPRSNRRMTVDGPRGRCVVAIRLHYSDQERLGVDVMRFKNREEPS